MKRIFFIGTIVLMTGGIYSCKQVKNTAKSEAEEVNIEIPPKRISELHEKANAELAENIDSTLIANELTDKYWKLVELMNEPVTYPEGYPKEAHIAFKSDGSTYGNSGCNSFFGKYILENTDRIRFSQMAATQMTCIDMSIETKLLQALETTDSYSLKGDTLILYRAGMPPLARFEAVYM
ncbi:MAG: META domain-containing protein [Candidatus Azobacteroides sp.]|nr:META domain-containing protein [Candidatus Azobacteroides sp.]